jgi:hypothetical protein
VPGSILTLSATSIKSSFAEAREINRKAKIDNLAKAIKDAGCTANSKPISVYNSTLDMIAAIDATTIDQMASGLTTGREYPWRSGLKYELITYNNSPLYQAADDFTLFLNSARGGGIRFPDKKPEYVLFIPADGNAPELLKIEDLATGYKVQEDKAGIFAVPR